MVDKLAKKSQRAGLKLVAFQLLLVVLIMFLLSVIFSFKHGVSALAGGFTFLLPNFIFVFMTFAHAGASKSKLIIRGFYAGEAIKLALTVILLSVFLQLGTLILSAFYGAFILLLVSQCFAPLFFNNNNGMKHDC